MKLFHVSEDPTITQFEPRPSQFAKNPVVWAVDELHLHNYLLPRNCPRVTYYALPSSKPDDVAKYLGSSRAVIAFERSWMPIIQACNLIIYHFASKDFYVQDEGAGYWVSDTPVIPQATISIEDCIAELISRRIEIRILPELWTLQDEILDSTLQFSFIRMRNAKPRGVV